MAKILWTGTALISGSIAGTTYANLPGIGSIGRRRTKPVNGITNFRTNARSGFVRGVQEWKNLTDGERLLWNLYGQTIEKTTPFGTRAMTGREVFMAIHSLMYYQLERGLSAIGPSSNIPSIPGLFNVGAVSEATPVAVGTNVAVSITNETGFDGYVLAQVSPGYLQTRLKPSNRWNADSAVFEEIPDGASTLITIPVAAAGLAYFVKVQPIQTETQNRMGTPWVIRCTSVTVPPP